jgi:FixJ family two-component response regulator
MTGSAIVFLIGTDKHTGGLVESIAQSMEAQFHLCGGVTELRDTPVNGHGGCVVLDGCADDGEESLAAISQAACDLPVVVLGETDNANAAVAAMKHGAFDYLEKPVRPDRLSASIAAAVEDAVYRTQCRQALARIRGRLGRLSPPEREALDFAASSVLRTPGQQWPSPAQDAAPPELGGESGRGHSARAEPKSDADRRARRRSTPRPRPQEAPPLAHDSMTVERIDQLTPRLRQTLELLLQGDSEKQVAFRLGLSRHTVHDYVKSLHRHFGVQSRGELMAICLIGAGA